MIRKLSAVFFLLCFLAAPGISLAAADQWAVIKDSAGKCYVKKVKDKTSKTIAGPFKTKAEADRAKAEKCPPKKKIKE
jgi:hypothetical protein